MIQTIVIAWASCTAFVYILLPVASWFLQGMDAKAEKEDALRRKRVKIEMDAVRASWKA